MPSFDNHGLVSELPCTCEDCWATSKHILIACQGCGEEVSRGKLDYIWPHEANRGYLLCPLCRHDRERWLLVAAADGGRVKISPSVRLRPSGLSGQLATA